MKLVLLPGMDGTGELFDDFLPFYMGESVVVKLPQYGPQDYVSLAKAVEPQLPNEPFILLAESFSGGLVPHLLNTNFHQIKGVIFIASFLSCPNRQLVTMARRLPIKLLMSLPVPHFIYRYLFLGSQATSRQINKFVRVVKSIPSKVLKDRLTVMSQLHLPQQTFDLPAVYIRAANDRLVSKRKGDELLKVFEGIVFEQIDGPHFVLQAQPEATAELVGEVVFS